MVKEQQVVINRPFENGFDWSKDFEKYYLNHIKYYCLVMCEDYMKYHFANIKKYACVTFTNKAQNLNAVTVGRLFDRFYTVESSRNSSGLGLSIAKVLIERMGGSISAQYGENKLSIVIIF